VEPPTVFRRNDADDSVRHALEVANRVERLRAILIVLAVILLAAAAGTLGMYGVITMYELLAA